MSSMVFPIDIVFLYDINGFSYRYLLRHQWFCPYISYFYMTSTRFPHRYRIFVWHPLVFPIDIVFLHDIYLFSTHISYFYRTSMVFHTDIYRTSMIFPMDIVFLYDIDGFSHRYRIWYDINGFVQRYRIFLWHLLVFQICIEFLYDINGFSRRYLLRHQWFCPYISYFYMTSTCFSHIYRIFIWHQWFFPQISNKTSMVFTQRYCNFIWHQWFGP